MANRICIVMMHTVSGKEKRGKGSKIEKVFGTDEDVTDARVRPLGDRIVHSGAEITFWIS
jgi:hypothetical protein